MERVPFILDVMCLYRSKGASSHSPPRHVSQLFLGKRRGTRIIVSSCTAARQ